MKLSTRNLLIIFGILVIAFLAVQFTKRGGKSKSLRSDLITMDTALVTKVEIASPKGKAELQKSSSGWQVVRVNGNKPAKATVVKSMLSSLLTIKPGRLASKDPSKWGEYEVDSTGTRVKVYSDDKLLTDIVLGRFGVQGQQNFYSFVRLAEDEHVYIAENFMKMSVLQSGDDYRNNEVLGFRNDSIVSVRFNYPDSAFSLDKKGDWFIGNTKVDSTSVAQYFQGLNFVTSKSFFDQPITTEATYTVVFSISNQPDVIIEGFDLADGFVVRSSENADETFLDATLKEKIFKGQGVFGTTQ